MNLGELWGNFYMDQVRNKILDSGMRGSSITNQSSQLITRIESVPFSRWHIKPRVIMGSATFFDAFDTLSLSYAMPVLIGLWHLNPGQIGILIGIGYLGQAIGALLFGSIAERFGRVFSAKWATLVMSIMAIACAFAGNYNELVALRFIQGIGVGGEVPVAAAYINEISRASGRGRFFMLYEMVYPIGLMVTAQLGTIIVPSLGWKWMFFIGGGTGIIIVLLMNLLKESPRWLISKGRFEEAERIIEEIEASTDQRIPVNIKGTQEAVKGNWKELFSPFYRGRTIVVWMLWFSTYFVSNGLNNWLPSLYKTVYKLPLQTSLRAASLTNLIQIVAVFACAMLIDKVGRKLWATIAFLVASLLLGILWINGAATAYSVMYLGSLAYGVIGTVTVLLYLYTPEIYPTRMRAVGTAFATTWLRLASAIAPTIVGFILGTRGISKVFALFACVSVIGAFMAIRMVETREKMLEEIAP
ncbi:MFS transporter [Moorella thermoacetica]|nr:MFS transporter [Moorella thermoacetica]AKX93387.1 putative niacin/nicotinamide transporter NaiP [Moorella thermoacetica]AKX96029.1 putative niacin/nicotinamide transporter NaiP [Moorella thermoacetica]OIQ56115.1 putative niacin/nicotinamide transporter NaiP [Moorella thermoacetica]QCZ99839.1 Putative niacin/nicotinamide transporter NaiP [Moorella thermoacetica]TYL08297.1 putative niacin/nicotinamide transporter NaiP [Moorella thermoacetica]